MMSKFSRRGSGEGVDVGSIRLSNRNYTELIPGGEAVAVTNVNKQRYVSEFLMHTFYRSRRDQVERYRSGMRVVLGKDNGGSGLQSRTSVSSTVSGSDDISCGRLLEFFNHHEVRINTSILILRVPVYISTAITHKTLLSQIYEAITGSSESLHSINLMVLRSYATYAGHFLDNKNHPVILWFWVGIVKRILARASRTYCYTRNAWVNSPLLMRRNFLSLYVDMIEYPGEAWDA